MAEQELTIDQAMLERTAKFLYQTFNEEAVIFGFDWDVVTPEAKEKWKEHALRVIFVVAGVPKR